MKKYLLVTLCIGVSMLYQGCLIFSPKKVNTMADAADMDVSAGGLPLPVDTQFLAALLLKHPQYFKAITDEPEKYRVQIKYTQISRDTANKPRFKDFEYRIGAEYTYPASTIKFAAAVLALEKLNTLAIPELNMYTHMFTDPLRVAEKPVYEDASSKTGKPSIAQYIRKILLVSDNDAFNRLYEFLGQQYFNDRLHQLGFTEAQMVHRLSLPLSDKDNRTTNPVWFMDANGKTVFRQPFVFSDMAYAPRTDKIGRGYMGTKPDGTYGLIPEPLDFSNKNRWPVEYGHQLVQWILFPESQPVNNGLKLTPSDYRFLWKYMSMLPQESDFPAYDSQKIWPSYVKFLLTGSEKGPWPLPGVRIFNKVGDAYGHLLDAAYIVDFDKNIEFILSAVIYCNSNEVLNDDTYDYETVGFPFMKNLGKVIYDHELSRKRRQTPNLSMYNINYLN